MLYKNQKIFKVTYQKYIVILIFYLLSVSITGCSSVEKKEEALVTDTETNVQINDNTEKNQKSQEEEKKLSELHNWDNARIMATYYHPNFGQGLILQNKDYFFYPEDDSKIVRINKSDGKSKVIYKANYGKNPFIRYCLADNGLYIVCFNNIYFCDFEGENKYKVISRKKLKKQITAIKHNSWYRGIKTIHFYKDDLYFVTFFCIWKLDLSTNKITKMSKKDVGVASVICFNNNNLYYIGIGNASIYKTNIKTGKCKQIISPQKNLKVNGNIARKYYSVITEVDGKIYYIQKQGVKNLVLYMYRSGKTDKKIHELDLPSANVVSTRADSGKIAFQYKKSNTTNTNFTINNFMIYDIKSGITSKIKYRKQLDSLIFFVDDMLFYCRDGKKYPNLIPLSYDCK